MKHSGRSVTTWGRMSANGVWEITFIDVTMNAHVYVKILADKMIPSLDFTEEEYSSMITIQSTLTRVSKGGKGENHDLTMCATLLGFHLKNSRTSLQKSVILDVAEG